MSDNHFWLTSGNKVVVGVCVFLEQHHSSTTHIPMVLKLLMVLHDVCHSVCDYSVLHVDSSSESSLPWPLRLFESSWCTVELLAAHKLDMDNRGITESNYYTMLHWYDSDGSKHSLDLRKLIRNKMKIVSVVKSCLSEFFLRTKEM